MATKTFWLCLDPNGLTGLWFSTEEAALTHKGAFHCVYPIEIPAIIYVGLPLPGSKVVDLEAEQERLGLRDN